MEFADLAGGPCVLSHCTFGWDVVESTTARLLSPPVTPSALMPRNFGSTLAERIPAQTYITGDAAFRGSTRSASIKHRLGGELDLVCVCAS